MRALLVVNCGSSSIKYSCFEIEGLALRASGLVERIGEEGTRFVHRRDGETRVFEGLVTDHESGLAAIEKALVDSRVGVIGGIEEVIAVGHRVVHGGEEFVESRLIDEEVLATIDRCRELAPLHNLPNLEGIRAAMHRFPKAVQVAVFDTAFHETMPKHAYTYAIPYRMYEDLRIRRYGFHGTSHRYVAMRTAELLGKPAAACNLITCHLGNGCSITAIREGRSVDTSMGFTPLEGLVMGTRSGDIDPAIVFHLEGVGGMTSEAVNEMLNRESGLAGLSGVSNDLRCVRQAAEEGDERAALAIDVFAYRLKKYIGAYLAVLGRTDCIVFSGGIGENASYVRAAAVADMEGLGVKLDASRNEALKGDGFISTDGSRVKAAVVHTDEERMIALDTLAIARKSPGIARGMRDIGA